VYTYLCGGKPIATTVSNSLISAVILLSQGARGGKGGTETKPNTPEPRGDKWFETSKPIIDLHCWTYRTWIKNSFVTQWCSYVWRLWGLMGPERKPMEHAHGTGGDVYTLQTLQIFSNYVNDLPSAVMDWEMLPANKERHHQHRASYAPII